MEGTVGTRWGSDTPRAAGAACEARSMQRRGQNKINTARSLRKGFAFDVGEERDQSTEEPGLT